MKAESVSFSKRIKKILTSDKYGAVILLAVLFIILSLATDTFLTSNNIMNLFRQGSFYIVVAMGILCIFMTGCIDLSVGATMGLAGFTSALLAKDTNNNSIVIILLAGIGVGLAVGAFNGLLVGYIGFPPFIATLGTQIMVRGIMTIISGGYPINNLQESFNQIGTGYLLGVPVPIYIMLFICVLTWFILSKTKIGRHWAAVGGNAQAAVVSGINVKLNKMTAYIYGHLLAAISGIVLCARFSSGQLSLGQGYEMYTIAGAIIGGASFGGGRGTILGVFCGSMVISALRNGMDLIGVNAYWQNFAQGAIIVLAVLVDVLRKKFENK